MRRMVAVPIAATVFVAGAAIAATPAHAAARVVVSPSFVSFGSRPVGSLTTRTVYVENTGDAPMHVNSVSLSDVSGQYGLAFNSCSGATVNPGQACEFSVEFHPRTRGTHNASAYVYDDAPAGDQGVYISGNGT